MHWLGWHGGAIVKAACKIIWSEWVTEIGLQKHFWYTLHCQEGTLCVRAVHLQLYHPRCCLVQGLKRALKTFSLLMSIKVSNLANMHVFVLWEKSRVPWENPPTHGCMLKPLLGFKPATSCGAAAPSSCFHVQLLILQLLLLYHTCLNIMSIWNAKHILRSSFQQAEQR